MTAAIFDFGGVMARSPVGRLHLLARELDAPVDVVVDTIFGGHGDAHDNPWHDAECGLCDLDDVFGRRMAARFARHGVTFDLPLFVSWVADAVNEPEPSMVDLVGSLRRQGIRTALMTNSVREFRPVIERTIAVNELFDDVVDSCEVGVRKPDPRIYAVAAERLRVPIEECVFVDDLEVNVKGARQAGMIAVHMGEPEAVVSQVRLLLGLAPTSRK